MPAPSMMCFSETDLAARSDPLNKRKTFNAQVINTLPILLQVKHQQERDKREKYT